MFHWVLLPKDWVSSFALHGNRTTKHRVLSVAPKLCWCRPHRRPSFLAWTVWDCQSWISSLVEICWKPQEIPEKVVKVAKVARGALDRDRFDSDLVQLHFQCHFCRSDFKGQVAESFLWSFQTSMPFVRQDVKPTMILTECSLFLILWHPLAKDKKSSGFISSIPHPQWIDGQIGISQLPVDFARMCTMRQMRDVTFYSMQVMPMATRTIDH